MAAQLKALLEEGNVEMAMHLAARADDASGLQVLLKHGAAVDVRGTLNSTPLHTAAKHGCLAAAAVLVESADVNAADDYGTTPLHVAALGCFPAVVELLLAAGAKAEAKTIEGDTPLHWANKYYTRREEFPHMNEREFAERTIQRSRVLSALVKALAE